MTAVQQIDRIVRAVLSGWYYVIFVELGVSRYRSKMTLRNLDKSREFQLP